MNLALGLILVFGIVLAAAVRKRKEGGEDRRSDRRGRMAGGQGRVQKLDVSPTKVDSDESGQDAESKAEASEEESSGDSESESELVCDTCGESFDTESGLKLHQQALH